MQRPEGGGGGVKGTVVNTKLYRELSREVLATALLARHREAKLYLSSEDLRSI